VCRKNKTKGNNNIISQKTKTLQFSYFIVKIKGTKTKKTGLSHVWDFSENQDLED